MASATSISDRNAYSESIEYLNRVCNESLHLAYASCVIMMFHLKGDERGSEPEVRRLGTAVSVRSCLAGFCPCRSLLGFSDIFPTSV